MVAIQCKHSHTDGIPASFFPMAAADSGFSPPPWALGFHWNQRRGVWQHPCGSFNPFGIHPADPRAKYRSYFPADVLSAQIL
jgi:hypothetical protein